MDNIRNELVKLRNEVWHIFQMDYSKRADFIPSILGRIDGILELPKRNCDVGTADDQFKRHANWCVTTKDFPCGATMCRKCLGYWLQRPYESEVTSES